MILRLLLPLLLIILSSCSGDKDQKEQTLRLNIFTEPPTLDPRKMTDATSANVLLMLFEGLTRIGEDHKPHPAAAEKIEISPDKRTYTFKLRELYWTNGERVTSYDFLYAWQKILDPKYPSPNAYKLYVIENAAEVKSGKLPASALGLAAPNPRTLIVKLKYSTPYFLELVAFPNFYPVNPIIDQKNPEWAAEAGPDFVSNGPFKLDRWEHENEIVAVKNTKYWDARSVKLDSLCLAMIDDTTTEFYMFEMDELDWTGSPLSNLPPEFIPALRAEGAKNGLPVHFYPATAVYYYIMNTTVFPLDNVAIRKALSYAINRKDIVNHITQGGQIPALSLVPPMVGWEGQLLFEDGNRELARELFDQGLKESGLTRERFPKLKITFNTNREHQKIAQAIQQQWKETLGIDVELVHFDWKVYLSKIASQDFEIARMGWIGDFHDPVSFLEPFKFKHAAEKGGNNETGWEHPKYRAYLDAAEKELDFHKRDAIMRQAEKLLISEMPIIPIYYIQNGYIKKPHVQGVYLSPLGIVDFKRAYIER